MSVSVDAKLLRAAIDGLDLDVPIRSARMLADGRVLLHTRDGRHVWEPPKPKKAKVVSESVSKPRACRKRATSAKTTGGKK